MNLHHTYIYITQTYTSIDTHTIKTLYSFHFHSRTHSMVALPRTIFSNIARWPYGWKIAEILTGARYESAFFVTAIAAIWYIGFYGMTFWGYRSASAKHLAVLKVLNATCMDIDSIQLNKIHIWYIISIFQLFSIHEHSSKDISLARIFWKYFLLWLFERE